MIVAVMQPYFLPYLGYFDLLNKVDHWLVFDTAQYVRRGYGKRNRVQNSQGGTQQITLPVSHCDINTAYKDVRISDPNWGAKLLMEIRHYSAAPYYQQTTEWLARCFAQLNGEVSLSRINVALIRAVATRLGIDTRIDIYSEMDCRVDAQVKTINDWGVLLAKQLGASLYMNRPGGQAILDPDYFAQQGMPLVFQTYEAMRYECARRHFVPNLSIVDVLMWNPPEVIMQHLADSKARQSLTPAHAQQHSA